MPLNWSPLWLSLRVAGIATAISLVAGIYLAYVLANRTFRGRDLLALTEREMRRVRGREIALVPQSPIAALNPALTIGAQFREAWGAHSSALADGA